MKLKKQHQSKLIHTHQITLFINPFLVFSQDVRESMLNTTRHNHPSNSATARLRASSEAVLPCWPPRNGDPLEVSVCTCLNRIFWIFKSTCLYKVRDLKPNNARVECTFVQQECACWLTSRKRRQFFLCMYRIKTYVCVHLRECVRIVLRRARACLVYFYLSVSYQHQLLRCPHAQTMRSSPMHPLSSAPCIEDSVVIRTHAPGRTQMTGGVPWKVP